MKIELLYFEGCPHYEAFASHLEQLIHKQGIESRPDHVLVTTNEEAEHLRFLGSPTLRVNGADVDASAAQRTDYGMQCRLYRIDQGYRGTPPDEWILAELGRQQRQVH
jgi:hypothetical protein